MKPIHKILILFLLVHLPYCSFAQKANWQNLDLKADSVFGISTEKAYSQLLSGKKARTVIVAVIDAGVDSAHEDLKAVLWKNPKNDKIHDLHGWNFIGSSAGDVHYDNLELTRQVRQKQVQFNGKDTSTFDQAEMALFHEYEKEKNALAEKLYWSNYSLKNVKEYLSIIDTILERMGKSNPTAADFKNYHPSTNLQKRVVHSILTDLPDQPDFKAYFSEIEADSTHYQTLVSYHLNVSYDPRSIVGDNYFDSNQRNYGNNDITGPNATHGTHVAGIIAADRTNVLGIKGIADHVKIMSVRVVPDGDERDKDVANAIRYAVDHGAKIINMSFGKALSQDKKEVDNAIKYAMHKGVLLIHAAGNDNKDLDKVPNFPNRFYEAGGQATAWIEVGASGWKNDSTLKAPFSNYGKHTVDVFAPGEQIYSTIPGNKYAKFDGTSMAAPMVAGLAALIWEYHPKLTAKQVKDIILRSVIKVDHTIVDPLNPKQNIPFSDLCITGGIVNAYNALVLADSYDQ